MSRLFPAAAAALLLAAPALEAEPLIDATDPNAIAEIARGYGSADLATDSVGDPMIRGRIEGTAYDVTFYGCSDNRNCRTLMFRTGFDIDGQTDATMAAWNREKRFGKAYLDDEGDPILEMNVNLFGGVTRTNLDDTFDWWRLVMGEFKDYIGF